MNEFPLCSSRRRHRSRCVPAAFFKPSLKLLPFSNLPPTLPPPPPRLSPPGIASLIRLLSSAGEESQPGLAVLLCEILTAVFLSLFVHGMATHSSNELFRIMAHPLNSKLWVTVFGGGARIPILEKPSSPARTPPPGRQGLVWTLSSL